MSFYKLWNTPSDPEENMITLWEGSEKTLPSITEEMPLQDNKPWLQNQHQVQQVAYDIPYSQEVRYASSPQVTQYDVPPQQQVFDAQAPEPSKPWQKKPSAGKALLMGLLGTLAGGVGTGLQTGMSYYQNKNKAYNDAYQNYLNAVQQVKTQQGQGKANLAQLNAGGFNKYTQGLSGVDPYFYSNIDDLKKGIELSGNFRYDPQYKYDRSGNPIGLTNESQFQGMPVGKDNVGFQSWQKARQQGFDSELANIEAQISQLQANGEQVPQSLLLRQDQLYKLGAKSGFEPMSGKDILTTPSEIGYKQAQTQGEYADIEKAQTETEMKQRELELSKKYGDELQQVEIEYKKAQQGNQASSQKINELKARAMETIGDPTATEDEKFFARQILGRIEKDEAGSDITDPPSAREEEKRIKNLKKIQSQTHPDRTSTRKEKEQWLKASKEERAQMLGLNYDDLLDPVSSPVNIPAELKPYIDLLDDDDIRVYINASPENKKKMLNKAKQAKR